MQATASTQTKVRNSQSEFDDLYKNLTQPGALSQKLLRYLRRNVAHSLHRQRRKRFPRRKVITSYPGQIVQSDLIDMQKLSSKNSGYNYILVLIDCFSKYLWAAPLKSKSGPETADALRKIFDSMTYPVQSFISDEGLEYVNQYVRIVFEERNIHFYHIKSKLKASTAERVNKTIKEKLWKYFTISGGERWLDVLEEVVQNYNNTFHSTIKMKPNEVTWENRGKVFKASHPDINEKFDCRLKKGEKVRVALRKNEFEKGYTQNWSSEIFTVKHIFRKAGVCWYRLLDSNGKLYPKQKYFYELNRVE